MTGYVGTSGGRKQIQSIWVGTASGRKQIQTAWVGTASGKKVWYQQIAAVNLTASAAAYNQINLSWTSAGTGATYVLKRGSTTIYSGTGLAKNDTGRAANTTYNYTLTATMGSATVSDTASAKTPVRPTTQKYAELLAVSSASYNGSNSNRNVNECYYGYYSSSHGQQKSLWCFNIPADVRNCIKIDRIDLRVYNIHAYQSSGGTTGLVIHFGPYQLGFPASFPGSTGILTYGGNQWLVGTPKPGYLSQDGSGWMTNVHVLTAPGRTSMAEEFRVNGAYGFGLASPSSSPNHYGYAAGAAYSSTQRPAMRIWYSVYSA